jgi:hypothetical protein
MSTESNHLFRTNEFREAAFYLARGVLFVRKEPPKLNDDKAIFVLQTVPPEMLSDWQAHRDQVSARALFDSQDLLRDVLHGKEPR